LRERREDVPILARYFLQRSAQQLGVEPKRMADAALTRLSQFHFPGNVRQLENICHWLTVMAPAQVVEVKDLPPEVLAIGEQPATTELAAALPWVVKVSDTPKNEAGLRDGPAAFTDLSAKDLSETHALAPVWESGLEAEALSLLNAGRTDVWDVLTRRFETSLIQAALATTRGRRIEAAHKLGIGRNTITRKIQELGIED